MSKRRRQQVKEISVSIEEIMRSDAFSRGVDDVRRGRVRFDQEANGISSGWFYERGRQFAILAPRKMPIYRQKRWKLAGRLVITLELNPEAVEFFCQHTEDIC